MIRSHSENPITLEVVTDAVQLAKSRAQRKQYDRNWAWFQDHVVEISDVHRGKCICVAGQELFVASSPTEALALAAAAHPDDKGVLLHYISREKVARIYAHSRCVVRV